MVCGVGRYGTKNRIFSKLVNILRSVTENIIAEGIETEAELGSIRNRGQIRLERDFLPRSPLPIFLMEHG